MKIIVLIGFLLITILVGLFLLPPTQDTSQIISNTDTAVLEQTEPVTQDNDKPEFTDPLANEAGDGYGMLSIPGGAVYMGDIKAGLSQGMGKVTYPGGASFEGEFHEGWPHGKGICTYSSGESQECTFIMGQRQ